MQWTSLFIPPHTSAHTPTATTLSSQSLTSCRVIIIALPPLLCVDLNSIVIACRDLVDHIVLDAVAVGVGYALVPAEMSQALSQQKNCVALPTKDRRVIRRGVDYGGGREMALPPQAKDVGGVKRVFLSYLLIVRR